MAKKTLSYWYTADDNKIGLPIYHLGDLSDTPDSESLWGLGTGWSSNFSLKGDNGGTFPAIISQYDTINYNLWTDGGLHEAMLYPNEESVEGDVFFRITYGQSATDQWKYYYAESEEGSCSVNDHPGWVGDPIFGTVLALATIDGTEYLGLYKEGSPIHEGPDQYSAWVFCYNEDPLDPWNVIKGMLDMDQSVPNPFKPGGYSEEGGGDSGKQNFGDYSDMVNPDAMPDETAVGALASGLISIFSPTKAQVQRLADVLWQKDFLDFLDSQFSNIEDLIISFGMVPFVIPTSGSGSYTWFDYAVVIPGTSVPRYATFNIAASQFIEFNMGNVSLTGGDTSNGYTSDSVLDYAPYSKLGIYLPFIGYEELNIDECRGKSINLKYRIDILSGAVLALISINGRTLYQFTGNCLVQLPITSQDCSQMIANTVNIGIAAASAGAAGAIASAGDALTSARLDSGAITSEMGDFQNAQHAAQVSNANGSLAGATANAAMGMKPNYKMSGAISGSTCLVGVKQPYLFLTTPKQSMPEGYEKVCGFPCNMGGKLGSFSGYTVVEDIRLNGLVATSPEVEEIYKLLKSGVII